ncbi:pentapeptide repeat-containing protein [Listeria monocytogenes]|uniref:pentapeptide repeat-containing protein n=1 Tax=Listeria monocytogenes TaxID=1639 RepID=UPI000874B007|nr:pentapeptide repeat-containing protein [Listeria monocytogenes]EAF1728605.1 pentapeptide repeat-containing protein [Listeria monocytogenes]EAF2186538.1 pentapeptide repeat-containing protein [Listeria monocytogenes]EAF3562309.1 pentapeptide repeat-containing protein [Listeria monocytogenes]EAF4316652.1 pentapeptide repeat-containing protein [Listeria monocytogenes]EAF5122448.1 pentapeptide repeat-containing protein [Listeria monocytogenes]
MKQEELDIILENHGKWLLNEGGERANLSNIDLNGIDLSGSNLERAYLKNTNLTGANLSNVNMQSTYLRGVNFEEACLTGANLSNADLNWINWQSIQGLTAVVVQVDTTRRNNQITYIKELGIWTTGCFQGTVYELRAAVEIAHRHNEKLKKRYYRVIDFILREAEE